MILTRWDWDQLTYADPWKEALTFLVWPILAGQPYIYRTEHDLHLSIATVLCSAGVPARHEAGLGAGLRIDFVSRGVGVEIKTAGSPDEIRAQLRRYGASGKLGALVLLTTCPGHLGQIGEHGYGVPTAAVALSASRARADQASHRAP